MTPPGPIKAFPKRLYTVLPRSAAGSSAQRGRSSSFSSSSARSLFTAPPSSLSSLGFFDTPPPPQGKHGHGPLTPSRLPPHSKAELEAPDSPTHHSQSSQSSHSSSGGNGSNGNSGNGAPHSSIALSSTTPSTHSSNPNHSFPTSTHNPPFFPYTPFSTPPPSASAAESETAPDHASSRAAPHKHRTKYHFDVGAYGIPKRGDRARSQHSRVMDELDLAVQVGEDAYFVRENAMGVADGVGGWSRCKSSLTDPSPSALFARRLMHFCSAEVASSSPSPSPCPPSPPLPSFTFTPPYVPFTPPPTPPSLASVAEEEDLDDEYDDFEEGLDVLLILERAYERALKAHVAPPAPSRTPPPRVPTPPKPAQEPVPLLTGSSTALLAVLDHAGPSPPTFPSPSPDDIPTSTCDAIIRIAHLGDCMGMLVRGADIVWRSDEMWWAFNTPLQLGPSTRTPPRAAQLLTLPVRADDILILASDGLSDNLWDEDVLDEVVRFRAGMQGAGAAGWSLLGRRTLAGMLSEALCSRARRVAEARGGDEIPFARRAKEEGRVFRGGKADDISVLVAVISPAEGDAQPR